MREKGVKGKKTIVKNTAEILRSNICGSIFSFVRDCPDYVSELPKKWDKVAILYGKGFSYLKWRNC